MNESSTRPYRSSVREQQARATRQRILDAAGGLFGAGGWAGTGMRDVADAAGVSVETVYKNFPSKGELLHRVVDVLVAGDDEPVPLAQRDAYLAMGTGDMAERAQAAAALVTGINSRSAPIVSAMREAASSEATLAALVAQLHERRRLAGRRPPGLRHGGGRNLGRAQRRRVPASHPARRLDRRGLPDLGGRLRRRAPRYLPPLRSCPSTTILRGRHV